ncbi:MAG: O-methyltransferase [Bacteroidales bacterium]
MDIDTEKYILDNSSPEDALLNELYRKTYTSVINPNMISGHIQGKLLEMITGMIRPETALEIGTYTGYSAISIARGLPEGSKLHTIEINDELADISGEYIKKAGLEDGIICHSGDALVIMKELKIFFDFIFIDGDKRQYPAYYKTSLDILNKGGYILADNVLWDGKVLDQRVKDPMTEGIRKFNRMVKADNSTENIIIPAMDGFMLVRKY